MTLGLEMVAPTVGELLLFRRLARPPETAEIERELARAWARHLGIERARGAGSGRVS